MVKWSYFNRFDNVNDEFLPARGEGNTMATQIVTAVNKLVYKWYNDGDVFDNTMYLTGWANDLSSYANWLRKYVLDVHPILDTVYDCTTDGDYEDLLKKLADTVLTRKKLDIYNNVAKVGSIYDCDGPYKFVELDEEDEEEGGWY